MVSLKVVAEGNSPADRANNRGHLFETVCAEVLRRYGYTIDSNRHSVNHSGIEIDIEGNHHISHAPLYAECKCYSADITSPNIQAFIGKYSVMWLKNRKSEGLIIAIPRLNSHAYGFYKDYVESSNEVTVNLLQESDVIESLEFAKTVVSREVVQGKIDSTVGQSGDLTLVCTERGFYWVQYIISIGSVIPTLVCIYDSAGNNVSNQTTYDFLSQLLPDLEGFSLLPSKPLQFFPEIDYQDPIVEMRGSSACFEYQFPASPQYFVGRQNQLSRFLSILDRITSKSTSVRSILLQGNSGWGKSSLVLSCCERANLLGHYALSIDARSALHPGFLISATKHIIDKFSCFNGSLKCDTKVGGHESAVSTLLHIGNKLEQDGKLLIVFFDQFENVFYERHVLEKTVSALLRITDAQTNVIFGFAWKSDLVGLTGPFPYQLRDSIVNSSEIMHLDQFSEAETEEMLDRLSKELRAKLRKDLRFLLAEFSQGYPWLLK